MEKKKLKRISLEASCILLCIMEELIDGRAVIEKGDEKVTVEQLDEICNLGDSLKVSKDFVHEGKEFATSVYFIIADDGQIPYRYTNNRGVDHSLIQINEQGDVCCCAVEYQEALRNFTNTWLLEMKDMVNLEHIKSLYSTAGD